MSNVEKQMRERLADGRDPITGKPFRTCNPKIEMRHARRTPSGDVRIAAGRVPCCSGCGVPVRLAEDGGWEHEFDPSDG